MAGFYSNLEELQGLTSRGVMEPAMLYEPPFTDLTPRGPDELFDNSSLDELVRVIDSVRLMAVAA